MSFSETSQSDLFDLFWDEPISKSGYLINYITFKPDPEKTDRKGLSPNPAAIHLLKATAAVHLLEPDHNKIDCDMVTHHLISRTHINPEDETDSDMPELVPVTETDDTDSDMPELIPVTETDDTDESGEEIYMSDDLKKKQTGCGSVDDKSERVAVPDTNLRYIGQERRHTGMYCHFHEARALETWYIYEDKNSNVMETKTLRQNIVTSQPKK